MGTPDSNATVLDVPHPLMATPDPEAATVVPPPHFAGVPKAAEVTGVSLALTRSPYSTWKVTTLSRMGTQLWGWVVS